jgi:hypothetical protein
MATEETDTLAILDEIIRNQEEILRKLANIS